MPEDINLGGGSRMIGRTPTYKSGGKVGQHCYSTGGKVLSCKKF